MGYYGSGPYGTGPYGVSPKIKPAPNSPGWHQTLPEVFLTIPDSNWPICDGLPIGTGRVDDFSVEREIVAANLPGQVRARSGFSIGDARAVVAQAKGRPVAPWARADRRVEAGAECLLYAQDEASGERWPLGAWQVKEPSGSLSSAQVSVQLIESQYAGRKTDARLPVTRDVDPAWIVDQLARQAGFHSTPPVGGKVLYSIPLCGGLAMSAPIGQSVDTPVGSGASWSTATGIPGLASADVLPSWGARANWPLSLAVNIAGDVTLRFEEFSNGFEVRIAEGTISARVIAGTWSTAQAITAGLDPNWPTRVEVLIAKAGATFTIRARSSLTGPLTAGITVTPAMTPSVLFTLSVAALDGSISGIAIGSGWGLWAAPNACMSLMGGRVDCPWIPGGGDVWSALQSTLDAYCGAGWVSLDGMLMVLNRHELAGSGRPKTLVSVDERVEDLAWSLDADDYADRLEVTWWPVTWPDEFEDVPEWGVGDKLHVPAGRSVTVEVDLDAYVQHLAPWYPIDTPIVDMPEAYSEWDANTASDGTGSQIVAGVTVSNDHTSPSSVRVTVTNSTAADAWMVGFDGNPSMILRGSGRASQDSGQVIEYGVGDADAKSPLSIDLGKHVQDRATAEALAGHLWGRVNRARYRLNGVRMPLDWSRDLGDVLTLVHPESDLSANVLVVRDSKAGGSGEIAQVCDLILLPPTLDDFAATWNGRTLDDVAAAWSGQNLAAFAADPLKTEA